MRSNVDFSQLRALVFCREYRRDDSGVTLVGIHDMRFSSEFPVRYEGELVLYVSFEVSWVEPVQLVLRVMHPGSREMLVVAEAVMEPDDTKVVIAPLPMGEFEFPRPGKYNFGLYANEVLVGSTRFEVVGLDPKTLKGQAN